MTLCFLGFFILLWDFLIGPVVATGFKPFKEKSLWKAENFNSDGKWEFELSSKTSYLRERM